MLDSILIHILFPLFTATIQVLILTFFRYDYLQKNEITILGIINFAVFSIASFHTVNYAIPIAYIGMIGFCLYKKKRLMFGLIIAALPIIITMISDSLAGIFMMSVLGINIEDIMMNHNYTILLFAIIAILASGISYILRQGIGRFIFNIFQDKLSHNRTHSKVIPGFLMLLIITVTCNLLLFKGQYNSDNIKLVVLNTFIIICYSGMGIGFILIDGKITKREIEEEYYKREVRKLEEYTQSIEVVTKEIRKFEHDFNNILITFDDFIMSNDMDGLNNYYQEVVQKYASIKSNKAHSLHYLSNIKVKGLKGLIASKLLYAQAMDYKVHVEILEPIGQISMKVIDLCRIVGNLLDNAIEACVDVKIKEVILLIIRKKTASKIIIMNPYNIESPPGLANIFEEGYSTKGEGRGLGLFTVRKLIQDRYPNVLLNTRIESYYFVQEIIIENEGIVIKKAECI